MRFNLPLPVAGLLFCLSTLNAEAALSPYTSAGVNLVYSSGSDITWTTDANLLGTMEASDPNLVNTIISTIGSINDTANGYDTPANSGQHTLSADDFFLLGGVDWFGAQAFVSYLNIIDYAGSQQWALPTAGDNPQYAYNQTGTPFGQLFYNELGGTAGRNMPSSPFSHAINASYWLATEYAPGPGDAWVFDSNTGFQTHGAKYDGFYVWAVSPGELAPIPVPGAVWLFGAGLLGMVGVNRRERIG